MGKKKFTSSAEMAYHNTLLPIAVTFPKPLVSLLHMGGNPNPEVGITVNPPELSSPQGQMVFLFEFSVVTRSWYVNYLLYDFTSGSYLGTDI